MSAVIVANETPSKGKPWWHHHFGPAEIALSVASTHQPEPRRDGLHGINASAFGIHLGLSAFIGYPSLHSRPAQSILPPPPPHPSTFCGHLISFFSCIYRFWEGKHHLHCRAATPFSYRAAFGFYPCRLLHDTTLTLHVRLDVTGFLSC